LDHVTGLLPAALGTNHRSMIDHRFRGHRMQTPSGVSRVKLIEYHDESDSSFSKTEGENGSEHTQSLMHEALW
ncbi:hypothetical protein P7K49_026719, partial [Saguinus oedipus]